jgi:hypothetical protein
MSASVGRESATISELYYVDEKDMTVPQPTGLLY